MDGRVYTPEDEIDVLHEEIGKARRSLRDLESAPREGRFVGDAIDYEDRVSAAQRRVGFLERELREARAAQVAADEAYEL